MVSAGVHWRSESAFFCTAHRIIQGCDAISEVFIYMYMHCLDYFLSKYFLGLVNEQHRP